MIAMSNSKMKIYTAATGVEMTIVWTDENEYKRGYKFLTDMGAMGFRPKADKPVSFYLKTKEQLESLFELGDRSGRKPLQARLRVPHGYRSTRLPAERRQACIVLFENQVTARRSLRVQAIAPREK